MSNFFEEPNNIVILSIRGANAKDLKQSIAVNQMLEILLPHHVRHQYDSRVGEVL